MGYILLFFFSLGLYAEPIQVPQKFYEGWEHSGNHPGHAPLITDRTLRTLADHIVDQGTQWFDPSLVQQGDIVYLNLWYLEWFEKEIHDKISCPYILLTCDVGDWYPNPQYQRLLYDPKLACWFCRNIVFSYHPKLIQVPMGQNERQFPEEPLDKLKEMLHHKPYPKKHKLLMSFLPRSYGDRDLIVQLFEDEPYCFTRNTVANGYIPISRWDYFEELAASEFTLSPLGLETDCVRTWEALALDCIPIVEHTFLDPLFDDLPVLIIHDWNEINESFLDQQKERLKLRSSEKAFFSYWQKLILERRDQIRKGELSLSQVEATFFSSEDLADLFSILSTTGKDRLIYRGFLSAAHALQIAEAPFLKRVQVFDLWASQAIYTSFFKNSPLLQNQKKVSFPPFKTFDAIFPTLASQESPLFFDFSYYRNSLIRDPNLKDFRHSLKKDLLDIYDSASQGTLFCGNMCNNEYVAKVLDKLCKEVGVQVQTKGNFWYFRKTTEGSTAAWYQK